MKRKYNYSSYDKWQLVLLIFVMIAMVDTVVVFMTLYDNQSYATCYYDVFAFVGSQAGYLFYPFSSLIIIYSLRNDFTVQKVLRGKSFRRIWCHVVGKVAVVSALVSLISAIYLASLGKVLQLPLNTWTQEDSLYLLLTGGVNEDITYWQVIGWYVSANFLIVWATAMVVVLMFWVFNSYGFGMILVTIGWIAIWMPNLWLTRVLGFQYSTLAQGYDPWIQIGYPLGFITVITVLGLFVKSRDFLGKVKEGV